MKLLYAPWRSAYSIRAETNRNEYCVPEACVFCIQLKENTDEKNFILKRFEYTFVALNKYPYNAGHLLVLPLDHKANLEELDQKTRHELIEVSTHCTTLLKKELKCHGLNVGLNLGVSAGGSIPSHLHMHIIPRWQGDTGFLVPITETKVISFDLNEIYQKLKPQF